MYLTIHKYMSTNIHKSDSLFLILVFIIEETRYKMIRSIAYTTYN